MYSLQIKENRQFFLWYKETWHALNQVQKIKHVRGFLGSQQLFKRIQGYWVHSIFCSLLWIKWKGVQGDLSIHTNPLSSLMCFRVSNALINTFYSKSTALFFKDFNPLCVCFVSHVTQKLILSRKNSGPCPSEIRQHQFKMASVTLGWSGDCCDLSYLLIIQSIIRNTNH